MQGSFITERNLHIYLEKQLEYILFTERINKVRETQQLEFASK